VLGPQGEVTQAGMIQRNDAHKLIEECMIAANVQACGIPARLDYPGAVRDHDKPPEAKVRRPGRVPQGVQAAHAPVGQGAAARFPAVARNDS
jgi:hypothetical protein